MSTTIHDLLDLEETSGGRYRCLLPHCGGSGLHVTPEAGDTGSVTCHSCGFGKDFDEHRGTGAAYLAAVRNITIREALERFGVANDDASEYERIQRKRRRTEAEKREAEIEKIQRRLVEIERLKTYMTPKERARFGVFCTTSHLRDETQEYAAAEREKILHAAYQRHLDDYESEPTYVDQ